MAENERIRSFVAIELDPVVLNALQALQHQMAQLGADVRWVRPDGMHLTLKFLGAVRRDLLGRVHAALAHAVRGQLALQVLVKELGAFPSIRRPRVLWAGMHGDGLVELAGAVEEALVPLGFAAEKRPFSPHVTLGRVNSLRGWPALEELFKAHLDDEFGSSDVRAVVVYRSKLQPGGAVYTALWTIPLTQHKGGSL